MRLWLTIAAVAAMLGECPVLFSQSRHENWKECEKADPEGSIAVCSAIIQSGQEAGTNLAIMFDSRGLAYMRKGDYDRAIQDYNQSLRLDPRSANAFYNRGLTYRLMGDYDRAISDYDETLRLTPRDADSFYGRGLSYAHEGDYDRALQDYDQALQINPNAVYVFHLRSIAYLHNGAYLRAIADYGRWRGILGLTGTGLVLIALVFGMGEFRKGDHRSVQFIRRFMGWIFAAEAVHYLEATIRSIPNATHQYSGLSSLMLPAFSLLVTYVSAMAWWTIWKGRPSARGFAIAASAMQVLIFGRQFISSLRPAGDYHATALIVGTVGLLAFLWREWPLTPLNQPEQSHFTSLFPDEPAASKVRSKSN